MHVFTCHKSLNTSFGLFLCMCICICVCVCLVSLINTIRRFTQKFQCWLKVALYNLPSHIRSLKLEVSQRFGSLLKRQTSLSNLAQASRMVVNNNDIISQMLQDWKLIDIDNICHETAYNTEVNEFNQVIYHIIKNCKLFYNHPWVWTLTSFYTHVYLYI